MGFEAASPEDSGEICVAELLGHAIGPDTARVRIGVKANRDPRLMADMDGPERDPAAYPKVAEVRAVRGYRLAG